MTMHRFREGKINFPAQLWPEWRIIARSWGRRDAEPWMRTSLGLTLFRERKRLTFVVSLAFLAGFLFYLRTDAYIGGIHISLITGAIYASIVGVCAFLVCHFLPSMRFMIEAIAVARLTLAFVLLSLPGTAPFILGNPLIMALVVVTGGFILSRMMHGKIVRQKHRLWLKGAGYQRVPATVRATPAQLTFVRWVDDVEPIRVPAL